MIEAQAEIVARANMQTLANVERLQRIFDRQATLLEAALAIPEPHEEDAQARRGEALNLLLTARGDSLAGHITATSKVTRDIQDTTRKALAEPWTISGGMTSRRSSCRSGWR